MLKSGGPINTVGYSNPDVDALIDKAAASADEAERKDLYKQIRTIVTSDAPLVFVALRDAELPDEQERHRLGDHADAQPAHGERGLHGVTRVVERRVAAGLLLPVRHVGDRLAIAGGDAGRS